MKVYLVLLGTLLGLMAAEFGSRILLGDRGGPFAHNPVIRKQADNVDLFEPDEELGHRLKGGTFIGVYRRGLVTASQIAADPTRRGKLFVLNLGDSSTSGWDSNVVVENGNRHRQGMPLKSPFQTYKTYSALLAESDRLYVVNAGVPGYTSLQGARYLRRLLQEFHRRGVKIDVVTVYFGNNDSAWNGNLQDSYVLADSFRPQLIHLIDQAMSRFRLIPRVKPANYADYLRDIITECRENGTEVILIEPVVPLRWRPGLRAEGLQDEEAEQHSTLAGTKVLEWLLKGREYFREGEDRFKAGDNREARELLEKAREVDYVVPRIKYVHRQVLHKVAQEEGVPLVSVGQEIPLDDSKYFLDYCHPIEPANRMIAEGILTVLRDLSWSRRR